MIGIAGVFALADTAKAHKRVTAGPMPGRVVLSD